MKHQSFDGNSVKSNGSEFAENQIDVLGDTYDLYIQEELDGQTTTVLVPKRKSVSLGGVGINPNKPAEELVKYDREKLQHQTGLFKINSVGEWLERAKQTPNPKMLLGKLWFEGELAILFAETNLGKSIFAVQIADAITKGKSVPGLDNDGDPESGKRIWLYLDFEMNPKQWQSRYSDSAGDIYSFSENFIRLEIDGDSQVLEGGDCSDKILVELEKVINEYNNQVAGVIVDNLTWVAADHEKAGAAALLMKQFKLLKKKYALSILVLAHTPKRVSSNPLTSNDLQGSKMLSNFADSIFAIGKSCQNENMRYLKQLKTRNTEFIHGEANVLGFTIEKADNFLHFNFQGCSHEQEHLKVSDPETFNYNFEDLELVQKINELAEQGLTQRAIAEKAGTNLTKVNRLLKKYGMIK